MRPYLFLAALALALTLVPASAAITGNVRVSVGNSGGQLAASSGSTTSSPALDSSGELVAFESLGAAADGDANGTQDIFVRITGADRTELISSTPGSRSGNNASTHPSMTDDGRLVAFQSLASDFVPSDGNDMPDVFVKNREDGTMLRVSAAADGGDTNGPSTAPALSPDGSVVAFCSAATNLVAGDENGAADVFVSDLAQGSISRITPEGVNVTPDGGCHRVGVSAGGQFVAFAYSSRGSDGEQISQVYLHNRSSGETKLVSAFNGAPGNGSSGVFGLAISDGGSIVAFDSAATSLVDGDRNDISDVFVWDASTGEIRRASVAAGGSEGNGDSGSLGLGLSGDGGWLAFSSAASNLLPGDVNQASDVFRLEVASGTLTLASADVSDRAPNGPSYSPDVSDNGIVVAYVSLATNIVTSDRNRQPDVFLRGGSFPEIAGRRDDPGETPTLDPAFAPVEIREDNGGLPAWLVIAIAAAGVAAALAAIWFVTGRRPEA